MKIATHTGGDGRPLSEVSSARGQRTANDAGRDLIPKGKTWRGLKKERVMKTKSTFAKLVSLALLVATLTIYTVSRAGAASPNPAASPAAAAQLDLTPETEFEFGLIGLARGQTARINAVLLLGPEIRPEPVEVEFTFHDREGNVMASERQTLLPGHASSFEIRAGAVIHERTGDIQPCISIRGVIGPETRNRIICTLEVVDSATGRTQFALNNPRMFTFEPN
jgi:hypothetical protein